jgi:hypothetical protein
VVSLLFVPFNQPKLEKGGFNMKLNINIITLINQIFSNCKGWYLHRILQEDNVTIVNFRKDNKSIAIQLHRKDFNVEVYDFDTKEAHYLYYTEDFVALLPNVCKEIIDKINNL